MYTLDVNNVNDAYYFGLRLIKGEGVEAGSRAGHVLALDAPLAVTYANPIQRVLFDRNRDANPFFHVFESLFLLAGRNDARWLDRFVGDFSSRFAEENGVLHGSYGFRWRKHFDLDGEGNPNMPDQLSTAVRLLKANPHDRRVVIQMWDAVADLGQYRKDVPCNLIATPRVVDGKLDLTVFNRSNDAIWGLMGANAVQFSFLLEYLAGRIGIGVGKYVQITNNAHVYLDVLDKVGEPSPFASDYPTPIPIGNDWEHWDADLTKFMAWTELANLDEVQLSYRNDWFRNTAMPLFFAHWVWKRGHRREALAHLEQASAVSPDWRKAAIEWMQRRLTRKEGTTK